MKISKFAGLDNQNTGFSEESLKPGDLIEATNCYVDNDGWMVRRDGFALASAGVYTSLWKGTSLTLAVLAGDLVKVGGGTLHASVGTARMWFEELPDGRVIYSNGTAMGVVNAAGSARTTWGVPVPTSAGSGANTTGSLAPGVYRWCVTHRRTADGLEGGPVYSGTATVSSGGLALTSLPTLADHTLNVYVTTANGSEQFYAGNTATSSFTLSSGASRVRRCMTHYCKAPISGGILPKFWRGRMLLAVGDTLYATKARTLHLFNVKEDARRFGGTITLVQPVEAGVWIGTTEGLYFLGPNATFDKLAMTRQIDGPVLLGSGAAVRGGALLRMGSQGPSTAGEGNDGALCIAARAITALYADGSCNALTDERYLVAANITSVASAVIEDGPLSQYIAVPQ